MKSFTRRWGLGRLLLRVWFRPKAALQKLWLPAENTTIQVAGMSLEVISPRSNRVGEALYRYGVWEPRVTNCAKGFLKPGMVAADIGADMGYYTCLFASQVGFKGRVLAFEPIPQAAAVLRRNVHRNHFKQVDCFDVALGSSAVDAFLNGPLQESRLDFNAGGQSPDSIPVRVERFDEIAEELGLDRLALVKIDVEGAEHEVLRGMESSLRRFRPALLVEIHRSLLPLFDSSEGALTAWLADFGYSFERIEGSDESETTTCLFQMI